MSLTIYVPDSGKPRQAALTSAQLEIVKETIMDMMNGYIKRKEAEALIWSQIMNSKHPFAESQWEDIPAKRSRKAAKLTAAPHTVERALLQEIYDANVATHDENDRGAGLRFAVAMRAIDDYLITAPHTADETRVNGGA